MDDSLKQKVDQVQHMATELLRSMTYTQPTSLLVLRLGMKILLQWNVP